MWGHISRCYPWVGGGVKIRLKTTLWLRKRYSSQQSSLRTDNGETSGNFRKQNTFSEKTIKKKTYKKGCQVLRDTQSSISVYRGDSKSVVQTGCFIEALASNAPAVACRVRCKLISTFLQVIGLRFLEFWFAVLIRRFLELCIAIFSKNTRTSLLCARVLGP